MSDVDPTRPSIHPRACVESEHVGVGTTIAAFAFVARGARLGSGCVIGSQAVVGAEAVLGDRVQVGPGARLDGPVTVGNDAVIGANVCVAAGLAVGRGAVVAAGAVLDHSVPAWAMVAGNPARITGYARTSRVLADAPAAREPGMASRVRGVERIALPVITNLHGKLAVAEDGRGLPFVPRRYFVVHDVPSREARGEHAHRTLHQLLSCVRGECTIVVDDGATREEHHLAGPGVALHVGPLVWSAQLGFSADAVLLVLASAPYDPADYLRDYDEFLAAVAGAAAAG